MYMRPTTKTEVAKIIGQLEANSAPGYGEMTKLNVKL